MNVRLALFLSGRARASTAYRLRWCSQRGHPAPSGDRMLAPHIGGVGESQLTSWLSRNVRASVVVDTQGRAAASGTCSAWVRLIWLPARAQVRARFAQATMVRVVVSDAGAEAVESVVAEGNRLVILSGVLAPPSGNGVMWSPVRSTAVPQARATP
jgi:hypothetical protein